MTSHEEIEAGKAPGTSTGHDDGTCWSIRGELMSALPPEADIRQRIEHVCFVPEADICLSPAILPSIEAAGACRQVCSWALSGHWLGGEDVHAAPTVDPNSWIGP